MADKRETGPLTHSPPRSKYLKQPVRRTASSSSSAPKRSYNATLKMLTVDATGFRCQCHLRKAVRTALQSSSFLTCVNKSRRITTSLNATVIPPPVKGWRMFHASPTRNAPSFAAGIELPCMTEGRKELGIRRRRSFLSATWTELWTDEGS